MAYADYMQRLMQELKTYISEEKKKKEQQYEEKSAVHRSCGLADFFL